MPYSKALAARIRQALVGRPRIVEKKMFGGVGFLVDGNLLVGIWHDSLIARLGAEQAALALNEPHVREFDITGRAMKGWVMIEPEGIESDGQLQDWIERSLDFVKSLPAR
jgi:TfoX/Sxy family transcriptional regulator of competence genes